MKRLAIRNTFFAILLFASACHERINTDTMFARVPARYSGVTFENTNTEDEKNNIFTNEYFYNGGGIAIGDINNDGLADLYFSSNQGENKLYLNKGDFKFEDITNTSGTAAKQGWKTGVSMVDINADGYLDIYVCRSFEENPFWRENSLFINNGDLTFEDKAAEYGLNDNSYSTQALFFDYDRDGDLDMFLLNHSISWIVRNYDIRFESKTENVPYVGNKLYENRGDKFVDISNAAGIYGPAHNFGLGVAAADLNNDGRSDVYASNDYTGSDYLLLNNPNKKFFNAADSFLTQLSKYSMGVDIADVNNDGMMDIFTLDMLPDNNHRQKELQWTEQYDIYAEMVRNGLHHQFMRNMLHLNNGMGKFTEIGQFAGVATTDWSWAALFADYDNDGWQDLFISNGYKRDFTNNDFLKYRADQLVDKRAGRSTDSYTEMIEKMPSNKIHNYLFKNTNGVQFKDVSSEWGLGDPMLSHGAAYGDLDNDGDLDLVINNMDEVAGIYRNNSNTRLTNNYLKIECTGTTRNLHGIGTRVTVYASGKMMTRELSPYRGFQSSVEPRLHFGLGTATRIDSLIASWPTGETQKLFNIPVNQEITLLQTEASSATAAVAINKSYMFTEVENAISFTHQENPFIDFKIQPLLQRMYSTQGPALSSADVNGDGMLDLYVGGAKGQSGALFLQTTEGRYVKKETNDFEKDAGSEDVDARFFDMDGDGDLDLYVVSGGYEFQIGDPLLQDRLYRNDGKGTFRKVELPKFFSSGSCVRPADIDHDGDLDLFVGGRLVPGVYPEIPESSILLNDGKGGFTVAPKGMAPALADIGMVTCAEWIDVNNDSLNDLVIAGEWMGIHVFVNEKGKLTDRTNEFISEKTEGFWNCILRFDFDQDGDEDLIVGNQGLNSLMQPSSERPATIYYSDFDNNGSVDPIVCYFVKEKSYPFPTRDELTEHVPPFKKKFTTYKAYSDATIIDVLSPEQLNAAKSRTACRFETTYFENNNGSFTIKPLPLELQYAPVFALAAMDINSDGNMDIVSGGNLEKCKARTGMLKGNHGFVFLGNGTGTFVHVPVRETGINETSDIRHLVADKRRLVIASNNSPLKIFELEND